MEVVRYEKIRPLLQTGDRVLFRGKGRVSRWIRWFVSLCHFFRHTKYSHEGRIVRRSNKVLLYESTSIAGGHKGVRLVPFSQVICQYEGDIFVRHIHSAITPQMEKQLNEHIERNLGKDYEKNIPQLISSAWDGWLTGHNKADMSTVFCSELSNDLDITWGILPPDPPANEYTPEDAACGGAVDKRIKTFWYEREKQIR